jgi:hypothetical protein
MCLPPATLRGTAVNVTGHLTVCTLMERWLPVSTAADGTDRAATSEVGDVGTQSAALNRE